MQDKLLKLAAGALAISLTPGCGLFDEDGDPFDITLEESFRVEYQIDAQQYCPPSADCSAEPGPSPERVTGPEIQTGVPIDIVSLTEEPRIANAAGQVKSVSIKSVDYTVENNTLTSPTSEYRIYLGPFGASQRNNTGVIAEPIVTVPPVDPMANPSGTAQANPETQAAASELLKTLQVSFIPYTQPVVEQGELFPPEGSADFYLDVNLEFVINARDVVTN
jgi:hypothetical protein